MEAPAKIEPRRLGDYLEVMSKAVFQTGISWKVVETKWPGIREAFRNFDPSEVASFTPDDLDELAKDTRVIRNRKKLEAIVENAHQMLALEKRHGTFRDYLRSHADFEATVADLRKRFRFLGDMGAYYFLWVVGEEVPSYEEWCASRGKTPYPVAQ